MQTNEAGINLIKSFEGCRLTAYQDIVGIWTIGYGDTENVHPGMVITQTEADNRLAKRLTPFETGVAACAKVPLTDNQFAALVAFAYNLGLHSLERSSLLAKLNDGDAAGAADEFLKWNRAGGKVVAGLTRRRTAERALFLQA